MRETMFLKIVESNLLIVFVGRIAWDHGSSKTGAVEITGCLSVGISVGEETVAITEFQIDA